MIRYQASSGFFHLRLLCIYDDYLIPCFAIVFFLPTCFVSCLCQESDLKILSSNVDLVLIPNRILSHAQESAVICLFPQFSLMDFDQDSSGNENPSTSNPNPSSKASNLNPDAPFFEPPSLRHSESMLAHGTTELEGTDELNIPYTSEFMYQSSELPIEWNGDLPPEWNVEDFSAEWWELIHNNALFRQYWMREYHTEDSNFSTGEFHFFDEGYYLEAEFLQENENADSHKDEQGVAESFHMDQMSMELKKLEVNLQPH